MSQLVDSRVLSHATATGTYDAVIVGAGPYGLSTAAHLLASGLQVAVMGKPFQLWREHMPKGMLLRSYWWATSLSDPHRQYSLERYVEESKLKPVDPFPIEPMIDYGLWFYKSAVPGVDETYVRSIERGGEDFIVTLVDGRVIRSPNVVMAPGLYYYAYKPAEYQALPSELVSHTRDHRTFDRFAGKEVLIVGKGQSALETAALAYESGVHVQLVSRSPLIWINEGKPFSENRPLKERLLHPKAGISLDWISWGLEHFPYAFRHLPLPMKAELLGRHGPMGSSWLRPRVLGKVVVHEEQLIQSVQERDNGVVVRLSGGKIIRVDHIILGTGYRVDIRKLPMLHPSLRSEIKTHYGAPAHYGAPVLGKHFESSVPGLYFVGISSVASFGPLYRFVVGTDAAARHVASQVIRRVAYARKKGARRKETIGAANQMVSYVLNASIRRGERDNQYDALVLEGRLRQSLATVRSLGRRGLRVAAMEQTFIGVPTFWSRWCQRAFVCPTDGDIEAFLIALEQVLSLARVSVLIPTSNANAELLSLHRERLEKYVRVALAKEPALSIALDKECTLKVAQRLGVPVPRAVTLHSENNLEEVLREVGLPAVVKPARSWVLNPDGKSGIGLLSKLVVTPSEAQLAVTELTKQGVAALFQQFLSGEREAVHLFYAEGQFYARFAHWAKRTAPPLGGTSVLRKSIAVPEDIGCLSERLIQEIGLEGYAEVEFRRDDKGVPYLMEINPRLSAAVELAVKAGVDFPYMIYRWANGECIPRVTQYRVGGWMRYLRGDIATTVAAIQQRGRPGVTPPLPAILGFFASFFIPMKYDYLDWRDPAPALEALVDFVRYVFRARACNTPLNR